MNLLRSVSLLALALASCALAASAAPIVSYSVSGSAGAYVLDPERDQHARGRQRNRLFRRGSAVALRVPSGWDVWDSGAAWDNVAYGGSAQVYTSNWFTDPYSGSKIQPGDTLSGFRLTTATLPVGGVRWFAYGYGDDYQGGDNFGSPVNPGFEGTAFRSASAVPGPMAALPFALLALRRRRRPGRPLGSRRGCVDPVIIPALRENPAAGLYPLPCRGERGGPPGRVLECDLPCSAPPSSSPSPRRRSAPTRASSTSPP